MNRDIDVVNELIQKGVDILAPQSVYIAPEVDIDRIAPKTVIYPGTTITGETTSIGAHCKIGMGGGAHLENVQIGNGVSLMQGVYRDSTLLDGVSIRSGAELRDNCLLEEGVDIGHTVGLKQTILFPNVVLGSLINFCDALMAGADAIIPKLVPAWHSIISRHKATNSPRSLATPSTVCFSIVSRFSSVDKRKSSVLSPLASAQSLPPAQNCRTTSPQTNSPFLTNHATKCAISTLDSSSIRQKKLPTHSPISHNCASYRSGTKTYASPLPTTSNDNTSTRPRKSAFQTPSKNDKNGSNDSSTNSNKASNSTQHTATTHKSPTTKKHSFYSKTALQATLNASQAKSIFPPSAMP